MKKKDKKERKKEKEKNDTNSLLVWLLFFKFILGCTNNFMYFCFVFFGIVITEFCGGVITAQERDYRFIVNWESEKVQKKRKIITYRCISLNKFCLWQNFIIMDGRNVT